MHAGLIAAKLFTMLLGLFIASKAYRGYRRYGTPSIRFTALGFTLVSFGAVVEGILYDVVGFSIFLAGTIQTLIVAAGLLCVLYALYGRLETDGRDC